MDEYDIVIGGEDLNARIGAKPDFCPEIDCLQNWDIIDNVVNKHGEIL